MLIKETIQLATISNCGFNYRQKIAGKYNFLLKLVSLFLKLVTTTIERVVLKEDKYIRVCGLRNRRLADPQLGASLNSICKRPVSTTRTVKRQLGDAAF